MWLLCLYGEMFMDVLGVGLVGCGTVGTGVARLLLEQGDRLAARAGRRLELRHVVVRDPKLPRAVELPEGCLTTDFNRVIADPTVQVVAELAGGTGSARDYVLAALRAGKHVVTANKALLAEHGDEVFAAAHAAERAIAFEASVAGGIPIIAAISQSLTANQITSIQGILNGTSNFILSQMAEKGQTYRDALAEAQTRGYAEADPTLDVDGSDAAHKLAILARLGFGLSVPADSVERHGIDHMHSMDLRYAHELGYTIKLLAEAWVNPSIPQSDEHDVALHVSPVLLRKTSMLAQVRGAFNAIQVVGDVVGEVMFQGPGAGQFPTASAVVADLVDVAVGRAARTFASLRLWESRRGFRLRSPESVRSRFYLRLLIEDRPGMLAQISRVLADEQISISSVIQHEAPDDHEGETVPLVIMTHTAPTGAFRVALQRINEMVGVDAPGVAYPVAD